MKKPIETILLFALLIPSGVPAQSSFNATWKIDVTTAPLPKTIYVWLLQDGRYQCKTCAPPIDVKADGQDQPAPRPLYDTISIAVLDDRTVREIEKKNGQTVSDEKFTVSSDGNTVTDEFANWKMTAIRVAKAPPRSHALSGSWQNFKIESVSNEELLFTCKLQGDSLTLSRPTGQSYTARLDGTDAPYEGDPNTNEVSLKRIAENTIEETDKLNGTVVSIARMTVSSSGKTLSISVKDLKTGAINQFRANKQ